MCWWTRDWDTLEEKYNYLLYNFKWVKAIDTHTHTFYLNDLNKANWIWFILKPKPITVELQYSRHVIKTLNLVKHQFRGIQVLHWASLQCYSVLAPLWSHHSGLHLNFHFKQIGALAVLLCGENAKSKTQMQLCNIFLRLQRAWEGAGRGRTDLCTFESGAWWCLFKQHYY